MPAQKQEKIRFRGDHPQRAAGGQLTLLAGTQVPHLVA